MKLSIPVANQHELDGVSLIGKVSVANARATIKNDSLWISWNAIEKTGNIKITISYTDNFKKGGTDSYTALSTVPLKDTLVGIPLERLQAGTAKMLLQGKNNSVNTSIHLPEKNNR